MTANFFFKLYLAVFSKPFCRITDTSSIFYFKWLFSECDHKTFTLRWEGNRVSFKVQGKSQNWSCEFINKYSTYWGADQTKPHKHEITFYVQSKILKALFLSRKKNSNYSFWPREFAHRHLFFTFFACIYSFQRVRLEYCLHLHLYSKCH